MIAFQLICYRRFATEQGLSIKKIKSGNSRYESFDAGLTWFMVLSPDQEIILHKASSQIMISQNSGFTWTEIKSDVRKKEKIKIINSFNYDILKISNIEIDTGNYEFKVSNILACIILDKKIENKDQNYFMTLDINSLNTDFYFVQIYNNQRHFNFLFYKNNYKFRLL